MLKYCAFDLEIAKPIPADCTDWHAILPLGITCAATMCYGDPEPLRWYHKDEHRMPLEGPMTVDEVSDMLDFLVMANRMGLTPLTWNGLGFDFDILGEESGRKEECAALALTHVDMMFQFFCTKGYPLALDTAAKSLGLQGKTEGMSGSLAPFMWEKSLDDRLKVLEYVGQDARTTLEVAEKAEQLQEIAWISKKGKMQRFNFERWLTVQECLETIAEPDQSWMTNPMRRSDFTAWTQK